MNDLIKEIEKANEFDWKKELPYELYVLWCTYDANKILKAGAKHQHSELQWAVDALKIAVGALNYTQMILQEEVDMMIPVTFGKLECKGLHQLKLEKVLTDNKEALEKIAALVPKGVGDVGI